MPRSRNSIETLIDNFQSLPEDELAQGSEILQRDLDYAMGQMGSKLTIQLPTHLPKRGLMQLARSLEGNKSVEFFLSVAVGSMGGGKLLIPIFQKTIYWGHFSELYT